MSLRLALIVLSLCAPAAAQASQPSSSPTSRPAGDEARRLLAEAAAAQLPGGEGFHIREFEATLQVEVVTREEGSSRARTNSGDVLWRYQKIKRRRGSKERTIERYFRHLKQIDGKEVWVAFDGSRRLLKERGRPTISLDEAAYAKDREQLDRELGQVRRLVRLMFLKDLLEGDSQVTFGDRDVKIDTPNGPVVATELRWRRDEEQPLGIWLGRDDHYVQRIVVYPLTAGEQPEELRFGYHRYRLALDNGEKFDKILVPLVVEFWSGGRKQMTATAKSARAIVFNHGLTRKDFQPPSDG